MSTTPEAPEAQAETPLDESLLIAKQKPSEAGFFYDAFLNADLFMPVKIEGTAEAGGRPVGWDEKFKPLFLTYQGAKVIPLFDRWERLKAWSDPQTPDYVYLRCHVLLKLVAPEVSAMLNLATPWNHYFPADILERLRRSLQPVNPA